MVELTLKKRRRAGKKGEKLQEEAYDGTYESDACYPQLGSDAIGIKHKYKVYMYSLIGL